MILSLFTSPHHCELAHSSSFVNLDLLQSSFSCVKLIYLFFAAFVFCLFCFTLCNFFFFFSFPFYFILFCFPFLFLYFLFWLIKKIYIFLFSVQFFFLLFICFVSSVCVCCVLLKKESRTDLEQHGEREHNCYFGLIWLKCLFKCKYQSIASPLCLFGYRPA